MTENKVYTAIGLMSGTSLDGVDAALIETDGMGYVKPLDFLTIPYAPRMREEIRACFGIKNRHDPKLLDTERRIVTVQHIEAVTELLRQSGRQPSEIDVIGFHGQTVYHEPMARITVQIGDGDMMARDCRIDVVNDFRSADVKAGGEGAPLAPIYHAARIRSAKIETPVVILNIGGVANVTWIGESENDLVAFDTGPGNAMMDDFIKARTQGKKTYDANGEMAGEGTVNESILAQWMGDGYFTRIPPKSLDRNEWDIASLGPLANALEGLSREDGMATLQAFTIEGILKSAEHMPSKPKHWYACGGGRHNKGMMDKLGARLSSAGLGSLHNVEELGWNGDATEAECFGYLAVRSLLGLPISFPKTTAVMQPMTGGVLYKKP